LAWIAAAQFRVAEGAVRGGATAALPDLIRLLVLLTFGLVSLQGQLNMRFSIQLAACLINRRFLIERADVNAWNSCGRRLDPLPKLTTSAHLHRFKDLTVCVHESVTVGLVHFRLCAVDLWTAPGAEHLGG